MGNIFNELSGELGDLDFGADGLEERRPEAARDWLMTAYRISGYVFVCTVCIGIILAADLFIRTQDNNDLIANMPMCSYVSMGVDGYSNDSCKTLKMIDTEVTVTQKAVEKTLVSNLMIIVPRRLQSLNILNSPKVRFIQEHTGNTRISITEAMNRFIEIKNRTAYKGADIDCHSLSINERGELSIQCDVLG